jgi:hypothetical protein
MMSGLFFFRSQRHDWIISRLKVPSVCGTFHFAWPALLSLAAHGSGTMRFISLHWGRLTLRQQTLDRLTHRGPNSGKVAFGSVRRKKSRVPRATKGKTAATIGLRFQPCRSVPVAVSRRIANWEDET